MQTVHGSGGVGKTQLAVEYVWRFANTYDAVWWVNAEQADFIGDQLAAFATALDLVEPAATVRMAVDALRRHCRTRDRWLIVLDNAPSARELRDWLLPGPGHVLVTSRDADWRETATPLSVDVFDRAESVALLRTHRHILSDRDADRLADALGDLPLALAQAAGVLADGLSPTDYLNELRGSTDILKEGTPPSYPLSLAAAVTVASNKANAAEPAAAQILGLCAALASEPIPTSWFTAARLRDVLPETFTTTITSPAAVRRSLRLLARYVTSQTPG